ncbi:MAG: FAD-binding oxidoreductase [Candidatus Aenigmarchaeota archaeon]|nr:FAD-binding oxidoreductase [Candidatus Aenigmarchaeota archaeon]
MTRYDAVVIGAGSVGVPTTYFLAKEGMKVLCIDVNSSSGQGQNKAAIGGVRATHSDPAKIKICGESLNIFSNWENETGTNIGWKKGGYCFPVYREKEERILKSILPVQKKFNLNIGWVDVDKIKEIVPGINMENLIGGTFSPDDGQVSPLLAAESFTAEAKKLGAEFRYKEEVTGFEMDKNTISGVRTNKEVIKTDFVVNAAGAHATKVCKMAGVDIPVQPDSHEAGITAPVKPFLNPLIIDLRQGEDGKTSNFYFGQCAEGQIIFCYTPSKIFPGKNTQSTSEFMPIIARRLAQLIPRLKNLTIRRVWRGLYPMTPDGVAVVDKAPGVDNFYLGIGMCGQGFMMGPGIGRNLTSMIAKGKPLLEPNVMESLRADRDFYAAKTEDLK